MEIQTLHHRPGARTEKLNFKLRNTAADLNFFLRNTAAELNFWLRTSLASSNSDYRNLPVADPRCAAYVFSRRILGRERDYGHGAGYRS